MKKFILMALAGFFFVAVSMSQGLVTFDAQALTNGDTATTEYAKLQPNTFAAVTFKTTNPSVTSAGDTIYVYGQLQVSPVDPGVDATYWSDYGDVDTLFIPTNRTSRSVIKTVDYSSGLNWPYIRYVYRQSDTIVNTVTGKFYFIKK